MKKHKSSIVWGESDIAQSFKALFNTPAAKRYSGRRMFRMINKSRIRKIAERSKYYSFNK